MIAALLAALALVVAQPAGGGGGGAGGKPAPRPVQPPVRTPSPTPAENIAEIPVPNLAARLEELSPSDPVAYFRLAEEVGEEKQAPGAKQLARRLYVLAFDLDRTAPLRSGVAHSACLALAALSPSHSERRWLRALAAQVDPADPDAAGQLARLRADSVPVSERAALQISTALGYIRGSEGRRATLLLDRPGNWAVISEFEGILADGGASRIRSLAEQWTSCPECHNRRIVGVRSGKDQTFALCNTCDGIPGPKLSADELIGQLRLEVSLLRGIHKLWSAQLLADAGDPLRDPNPADLAIIYRVDVSAVLWRNSRWEPDPTRAKPPANPAPGPADPAAPAPPAAAPQPAQGSTTPPI